MVAHAPYDYKTLHVTAFDFSMPVAQADGSTAQWFPLKHMCTWLGIDAAGQSQVLHADSAYEGAILDDLLYKTPTRGWHPAVWIRRDKLALWLLGIDARRCKLGSRERLQKWQTAVLKEAERLLFGGVPTLAPAVTVSADVEASVRVEFGMRCLDCDAPHWVIHENGRTTVMRVRPEEMEE